DWAADYFTRAPGDGSAQGGAQVLDRAAVEPVAVLERLGVPVAGPAVQDHRASVVPGVDQFPVLTHATHSEPVLRDQWEDPRTHERGPAFRHDSFPVAPLSGETVAYGRARSTVTRPAHAPGCVRTHSPKAGRGSCAL